MRPPNLKTLARQLDLSVTTVSRALKDGPEVRPETAARVKAAATALGYRPDPRGVSLRTGRTGVIAVLFWEPHVDDVGDSSITSIVEGVCRRLEGTGRAAMVQLLLPGMDGVDRVSRIVEGRLADGLILSGTRPGDERVRYMQERRFPFVTYGRTGLPEPHPWYDIDNELAARQATGHLIGLGCRRVATLDPPRGLSFAEHRLCGYRRALAEAGLAFDPGLVVHTGLGAAQARAATRDLMALPDPPTGVVCATGVVALGVLAGLRDLGRAPMRDVFVVSRDGTRLAGYLNPPLPTCFASLSDTGWRLCDFLLRAIDGEPPATLQLLVPTRLVLPGEEGRDPGRAPRRRRRARSEGRRRAGGPPPAGPDG